MPPAPGDLIPLAPGVSLLAGLHRGGFPNSHSVLIEGPDTVLIDTGAGIDVLRPLADSGRADLVLNTHTHPDHAAGNFLFAGREILVPETSQDSAGRKGPLSERLAEPGSLALYWQEFVTRDMGFEDQPPTGSFVDGQEFVFGGVRLLVVATPGHTADHCCFFLPEQGILLSADIDLTPFGPFYGHRESDLAQLRASMALVKSMNPRLLVSSHRLPLDHGIDQALDAFLGVLDQREARLLEFLRAPRRREEIVEASLIYGGFPRIPRLLRYWEGQMVDKHLAELRQRGLVQADERGYAAC
jgi:glyoxylase-like metal-dependent hydrolase (beta-lactamase superfamily II)